MEWRMVSLIFTDKEFEAWYDAINNYNSSRVATLGSSKIRGNTIQQEDIIN